MTAKTAHKVPSTAEIVSSLALAYMTQDELAYNHGVFNLDGKGVGQVAAHARAEQIAATLFEITGERKWEALMMKHRGLVTRDGMAFATAVARAARAAA